MGRALQNGDIDSLVRDGGDAGAVALGFAGGNKGLGRIAQAEKALARGAEADRLAEAGSAVRKAEQLVRGAERALEAGSDVRSAFRPLAEASAGREAAQQAARQAETTGLAGKASSGGSAAGKAAQEAQAARQAGQAANARHAGNSIPANQKAGGAIDEISFTERTTLPPSNPDPAQLPRGATWTDEGIKTARGSEYTRAHARDSLQRDVYTRNGRYYALENGKLNPIPAKEVQTVPRLTPSTNANGAITAADLANAARNSGKIELPLYTISEANHLPGSKNGLIAVLEPAGTGNPAASAYQAGTAGAVSDIATGKQIVPALRYNNPNSRGMDFVKFDGYEVLPDGQAMLLIDAKMRLPLWSEGGRAKVVETLQRVQDALNQNPGFRVMYEFPSEASKLEAADFIRDAGFGRNIQIRVREK